MAIERLLRDIPLAEFIERHYRSIPFAQPGGARDLAPLGSWETIARILAGAAPDTPPDLLVVKEGRPRQGQRIPAPEEARELVAAGHTLVIRHAERHDPDLAALAAGFQEDFCGAVDVHIYLTPPRQFGFGWHYDAEEVFIIQTRGRKGYLLRKNTVNPWPLLETMPADLMAERETTPVLRCDLAAGDWLYIPAGWWHRAETPEDAEGEAISLAVGVMAPAAIAVHDFLRPQLLRSLIWRRRLPPAGRAGTAAAGAATGGGNAAADLEARYRELLAELGADLARILGEEETRRALLDHLRRLP